MPKAPASKAEGKIRAFREHARAYRKVAQATTVETRNAYLKLAENWLMMEDQIEDEEDPAQKVRDIFFPPPRSAPARKGN